MKKQGKLPFGEVVLGIAVLLVLVVSLIAWYDNGFSFENKNRHGGVTGGIAIPSPTPTLGSFPNLTYPECIAAMQHISEYDYAVRENAAYLFWYEQGVNCYVAFRPENNSCNTYFYSEKTQLDTGAHSSVLDGVVIRNCSTK